VGPFQSVMALPRDTGPPFRIHVGLGLGGLLGMVALLQHLSNTLEILLLSLSAGCSFDSWSLFEVFFVFFLAGLL